MSRINARLDEIHIAKLDALKGRLHLSTTEVIKRAIEQYYQHELGNATGKIQTLLESDFIGCAEAESDLSAKHKSYLTQSVTGKYDHR